MRIKGLYAYDRSHFVVGRRGVNKKDFTDIYLTVSLECFSCLNINDPGHCNNTIFCKADEACYQDSIKSGQTSSVSLGCKDNQQCSVASSGAGSLVGRDITKRQDDRCHECCSTDRCNDILCARRNPAACIDDKTIDCPRLNSVFGICQDIHNAKSLCPKFCNLCDVVDGAWTEWTQWSNCDVTCETGHQSRIRTCTNPTPANGGLGCKGNHVDTKQCQKPLCPVHGGWSEWTDWGSCSSTCDIGLQRRQRTCTNPDPLRYGDHCFGLNMDDRLCMPGPCADGGWSGWGSWSSCSVTCGEGFHSRSRTCSNPRPSLTGRYCDGDSSEVVACRKAACKGHPSIAFRSFLLTNYTVSQKIVFITTTLNEGNGYDNTTGIFTAPIDGTYLFSLQLCVKYGQNMYYAFVVNNQDIIRGRLIDEKFNTCHTSDFITVLKSNDRVYVKSRGTCSLDPDNQGWNTFAGALVYS